MRKPYKEPEAIYIPAPSLYPMGALTFAIACSHCKNIGSYKCLDCKSEIESGFELKENNNAERNS